MPPCMYRVQVPIGIDKKRVAIDNAGQPHRHWDWPICADAFSWPRPPRISWA